MNKLSMIFVTILIIAGCQAVETWDGMQIVLDDSDKEMKTYHEVSKIVTQGMPVEEAVKILDNQGYRRSAVKTENPDCLVLIKRLKTDGLARAEIRIHHQDGKVKYFDVADFSDNIQMHFFDVERDDVLRFITLEMPVEEAVRIVESQGFRKITASKTNSNRLVVRRVTDPNWIILEKRFKSDRSFPSWVEIRIFHEDGKVKEVEAETLPQAVL